MSHVALAANILAQAGLRQLSQSVSGNSSYWTLPPSELVLRVSDHAHPMVTDEQRSRYQQVVIDLVLRARYSNETVRARTFQAIGELLWRSKGFYGT